MKTTETTFSQVEIGSELIDINGKKRIVTDKKVTAKGRITIWVDRCKWTNGPVKPESKIQD